MEENGGKLAHLTPDELIEHQRNTTNSERYEILDLLQNHVLGIPGRYNYKLKPYTTVRSFFKYSRAELPRDVFHPRAEIPPVVGTLTADEIKLVVLSANPVHQAVFLCMLQGGMDENSIVHWSNTGYEALTDALPETKTLRREDRFIRIELPGRKKFRNIKPFYTYIGADAIDSLENWLKRRPEGSEAIFINQYGRSINEESMRVYWTRKLKRLGIIEPGEPGNKGNRYGKSPHEIRDVFRSLWEKSPAKGSVAEFAMGHQIDPLEYNKAFLDKDWTRREYLKCLPYLQIMSSGKPFGRVDEDEVESLRRELSDLRLKMNEPRDEEIEKIRIELEEIKKRMNYGV